MLRPNQKIQVGRRDGRAVIQIHDVGLSVPADQDGRLGHLGGDAGRALESLDPTNTFFLVDRLFIAIGRIGKRLPRPELSPSAAQGDSIQTKGLQSMQ